MSNSGVDAYWKFYREQSKKLEEVKVVFRRAFAKRKYINKLWKKEKELVKAAKVKAEIKKEEAEWVNISEYVDVDGDVKMEPL